MTGVSSINRINTGEHWYRSHEIEGASPFHALAGIRVVRWIRWPRYEVQQRCADSELVDIAVSICFPALECRLMEVLDRRKRRDGKDTHGGIKWGRERFCS